MSGLGSKRVTYYLLLYYGKAAPRSPDNVLTAKRLLPHGLWVMVRLEAAIRVRLARPLSPALGRPIPAIVVTGLATPLSPLHPSLFRLLPTLLTTVPSLLPVP